MSKHDEAMAAIIGKAMLREDVRKQILADPDTALAAANLPVEYRESLLAGLREIETGGLQSHKLPKKFGTNAWGVGGSVL
jgi:hypothetical protein